MTDFRTSADATRSSQIERGNTLSRSITAKRSDRIVRPLREALDRLREDDPDTPPALPFGYGLVEIETERVFREVDSDGRLHLIDVIQGDQIDGILAYLIDAEGTGIVYPGTYFPGGVGRFPGNIDEDGQIDPPGTIFAGRFSGVGNRGRVPPNGSQIRLFDGTQQAPDPDLVAQTSVDNQFIGRGLAYVWTRMTFRDGVFNGDPGVRVFARARKVVDPRFASNSLTFENTPKSFSVNPYRFIFDYLIRPTLLGGAGLSPSLINLDSFQQSTLWAEILVDVQQFSRTAILTTRTNQQTGTPPINTNHILEFEESVCPFQFGDVVNINIGPGQTTPTNLSTGTDYFVIPIRPLVDVFQLPGIALAASLEDALAGVSIPQGTRASDISVTKVKEIRHQAGVVYRSGEQVLDRMLESCGARLFIRDGKIAITQQSFPEEDEIETVGTDELIGSIAISTSIDSDERATALTGSFQGITNLFQPRPYPSVSGNGIFEAEDGEPTIREFNLPFIPKASIAQRLATLQLRRLRQELSVAFSGDLSLYRLRPNKVFTLGFSKYGLDENTTFEVRSQVLFLRISNDVPFLGVNIEGRQLEEGTFDLDISNERFQAESKIPGLATPFEVEPPTNIQVAEELFETRPGAGIRSKAIISWTASSSLFVVSYEVSFRRDGTSTFFFLAQVPGTETSLEAVDLAPGRYDFRVSAVNSLGRKSDPDDGLRAGVNILGLAARPDAPTLFFGQVLGAASVLLRWKRTNDLDVREGGFVEIRHSSKISGAVAKDSIFLDSDVGGQTSLSVPFRQGTYFLRFEDSSGQFSDPVSWSTQDRRPVGTAQIPGAGGVLEDTAGFTLQEDNTFPSSDPNNTLIFVTDHLELPLQDTLDDEADFDAIPDIDAVGGGNVEPNGIYFFSSDVEIDTPRRVLVEAVLETEIFDLSASLDDEPDFDQIPNVDLVASALLAPGLATAEIEVRFSNDPVVDDTFGPWERIDTQFVDARSFQFRIVAESFVPTVNIRITQARVRLRAVPL